MVEERIVAYALGHPGLGPKRIGERHVGAERPGELAGMDSLYACRLGGTKGAVWQLTAIDVASPFGCRARHLPRANRIGEQTSKLAKRVAVALRAGRGGGFFAAVRVAHEARCGRTCCRAAGLARGRAVVQPESASNVEICRARVLLASPTSRTTTVTFFTSRASPPGPLGSHGTM